MKCHCRIHLHNEFVQRTHLYNKCTLILKKITEKLRKYHGVVGSTSVPNRLGMWISGWRICLSRGCLPRVPVLSQWNAWSRGQQAWHVRWWATKTSRLKQDREWGPTSQAVLRPPHVCCTHGTRTHICEHRLTHACAHTYTYQHTSCTYTYI